MGQLIKTIPLNDVEKVIALLDLIKFQMKPLLAPIPVTVPPTAPPIANPPKQTMYPEPESASITAQTDKLKASSMATITAETDKLKTSSTRTTTTSSYRSASQDCQLSCKHAPTQTNRAGKARSSAFNLACTPVPAPASKKVDGEKPCYADNHKWCSPDCSECHPRGVSAPGSPKDGQILSKVHRI
ncbi:hypothetical protein FQN57_000132 [Myotisia sp. PD_48]|nr:hypothetical protein FQN57_000132 [Myotisia sp. PD_48]